MQNAGLKTIDTFCRDHELSRSTFYRLARAGELKTVRVRGSTRIAPQHEAEWLASLPVMIGKAA